jgi:hypothetical protein
MIHKKTLPLLIFIAITTHSCQDDDDFLEPQATSIIAEIENELKYGEKIILGKKLKNPYSVENMKKAFQNIKFSSNLPTRTPNVEISTSHYYVKFIPKDSTDLKIIEADSSLIAYDYPLDYEILQMGDYYHDPEVPKDQPTYHYASVEIDKTLPRSIEYEILSNLFIPDPEHIGENLADLLEDTALSLTVNLGEDESVNQVNTASRRSKWRPAGRIRVWDDVIGSTTNTTKVFSHWEYYNCETGEILSGCPSINGVDVIDSSTLKLAPEPCCKKPVYTYITNETQGSYIPMEGVKVRARRWFTTHTGITNAEGYYSCNGRFRRPANYKIKWKKHNFSIWWSWLSSAKYNGPKKRGDWNLNIKGGHQEYYATIFRGAHLYFYGNMFGLTRPKHQTFVGGRLVINAKKINDRSNYSHARSLFLGADILLKEWGSPTDRVFGTTIHELAHAAHSNLDYSSYNSLVWKGWINPCAPSAESCDHPGPTGANARRLMETWASTVEHFIMQERYVNFYNVQGYTYEDNFLQLQQTEEDNFYTSCGIDMIDSFNQRIQYNSGAFPVDRVENYTITQLENALNSATTWNQWRDNLINNEANNTEQFLNELFANWTN